MGEISLFFINYSSRGCPPVLSNQRMCYSGLALDSTKSLAMFTLGPASSPSYRHFFISPLSLSSIPSFYSSGMLGKGKRRKQTALSFPPDFPYTFPMTSSWPCTLFVFCCLLNFLPWNPLKSIYDTLPARIRMNTQIQSLSLCSPFQIEFSRISLCHTQGQPCSTPQKQTWSNKAFESHCWSLGSFKHGHGRKAHFSKVPSCVSRKATSL